MPTNIAGLLPTAMREQHVREKRVNGVTHLAVDGGSDSHECSVRARVLPDECRAPMVDEPLDAAVGSCATPCEWSSARRAVFALPRLTA